MARCDLNPDSSLPISPRSILIAGAGLAGALLATLLARRGWQVDVLEKRPDQRVHGYESGRSINLALAERGLHALRLAGIDGVVLANAVVMRGRRVHARDGSTTLYPYGRDDSQVIYSVHRGRLNHILLDAAEAAGARIHFQQRVEHIDFLERRLQVVNDRARSRQTHEFTVLVGADGAGSAVRRAMQLIAPIGERVVPLQHGYKELEIPPAADGGFRIDPHALHIWPRGNYMCIALPNAEHSFTVTLFLPLLGATSFATVRTGSEVQALFARDFPDALAQMPRLREDFCLHPTSPLATLYLDSWHLGGDAVLIGDAAHAMVPFHGQGMNCAFEDCVALVDHLERDTDTAGAFAAFSAERRPNAEAIQAMALENYVEMRDRVCAHDFLLQTQLERLLAQRHPGRFVPRYEMVTFTRIPYATAYARGQVQRQILIDATRHRRELAEVDLDAVDARIRRELPALA